jgi:uncharacterized protein (DUF58 family)
VKHKSPINNLSLAVWHALLYNSPMPNDNAPRMKLNIRILPFLCILMAVLYLIDSYQGWSFLLIALGGLWLVSYYWARNLKTGLTLRREMRFGWAQVGDRLEERFTITNKSSLPALWVQIVDSTNLPGYQVNQVRAVGASSEVRWQTSGVCMHRGLYVLGPTTIKTSDPFGVYTVSIPDPSSATLMVMPPVVPLPPIQVAPGGRAGEGAPRVDAPERTVSSASVREYLPGDSLRWIHWPTSARRDDLFVRVFEGSPAGDWWIILDLDQGVQIGEGQNSTQEHGIILTASLADLGMRTGHAVGLMAHGDRLVWLPPRMSDEHNWEILRSLALIEPGEHPLSELLETARPSLGRNTSLILITPSVDGPWVEALIGVRHQGTVPTVLAFDPQTFGGSGNLPALKDYLVNLGIAYEIISRDLLDRREARPGQSGHWDWRVTPLGKAVPTLQPDDLSWRNLNQ